MTSSRSADPSPLAWGAPAKPAASDSGRRDEDRWDRSFAVLVEYADAHGDGCPPADFVTSDGFRLGRWVSIQRRGYRRGTLGASRTSRLESVAGWMWDARPLSAQRRRADDEWNAALEALQAYARQHGAARPPRQFVTENGFKLGAWVSLQRSNFARGRLAQDRMHRLETVPGWAWRVTASWEDGFAVLQDYVGEHGNASPPSKAVTPSGFRLGQWVIDQRVAHRAGRLAPERVIRLEQLPGWLWEGNARTWEESFGHLTHYVGAVGHARPPADHLTDDGFRLGQWVGTQRTAYRAGHLPEDRIRRLQQLDGWAWDGRQARRRRSGATRSKRWEQAFAKLLGYVEEIGHARPPVAFVTADGFRLGEWVNGQRTKYMCGQLRADRVASLESVPGWAWDARAKRWELALERLGLYADSTGHACPPGNYVCSDGFWLGQWVQQQRRSYRAGTLSIERARELEGLPGWVWDGSLREYGTALGRCDVDDGVRGAVA